MMKKVIVLLTALAVAAGFAGCQRESSFQSQEPQAASGKKVNTQLVLNVATSTAQTKQSSTAVQVSGGFQGLTDATLLTYTQASGDGQILKAPEVAPEEPLLLNQLFSTDVTRRVVSVKLPVETNTLVFYGRSPVTDGPDEYGTLAAVNGYVVNKDLGTSHFDLGARLTDETAFNATKTALANMLSDVMSTGLAAEDFTLDNINVSASDCKSWADYSSLTNESIVERGTVCYVWEEKLAYLYNQMTGISYNKSSADTELRAGSGKAILEMAKGIWEVIYPITKATATSKAEAVAKKLAQAINTKLEGYFSYATTGEPAQPDWAKPLTFNGENDYAKFPTNFNLMEGIAYLKFNTSTNKFEYPQDWTGMGGVDTFQATDIFYPAQLLYFGNSPVQTSEVEYSTSDYPTTASWNTYAWTTNWPTSHITAASRSVAMVKNIRYGVAMLETKVAYKDISGSVKTNNPDLPDQTMNIDEDSFKLTGVIVGGQYKSVGWNFLPVSGAGEGFIYDKFDAINIPASSTSTANYTVVFDNYNSSAAATATAQNKVYVALELLNNEEDFYGRNNWVRKGDTFYLVGVLDPGDPNNSENPVKNITWPTDGCIIPPYNASGASTQEPRIFVQDYKTTVTFKIGPNSLQYAYLTVPDLRSSNMTLGLSVDIQWRQGLIYDDVVVGQ
ncbi:MAG: hypothetical protein IKG92_05195 [Bacteroidales bacterium]|nr:hypothetical protein [Bacteroidales bacterium]